MKLYQKRLKKEFRNELKFQSTNNIYALESIWSVRLMSRHHKRIVNWDVGFRNKYASFRWIDDARGCGWGCPVAKRRFLY